MSMGTFRQLVIFGAIGAISTAAYAVLYLAFRTQATSAAIANALALVVTAVANTRGEPALTFGVREARAPVRDHAAGLLAFAFALGITTVAASALATQRSMSRRHRDSSCWCRQCASPRSPRFLILRFASSEAANRTCGQSASANVRSRERSGEIADPGGGGR